MNKQEFYNYIYKNFEVGATEMRLIKNILDYVECQGMSENEQYLTLCELLDNIGLTDAEIRKVYL